MSLLLLPLVFFPPVILRQVYEYSSIDLDTEDLAYSAFVLDPVPSKSDHSSMVLLCFFVMFVSLFICLRMYFLACNFFL